MVYVVVGDGIWKKREQMLDRGCRPTDPVRVLAKTDDLVEAPPSQGDEECTRAGRQSSPGRLQNIKPFGPFHF